MGSVFTSNKMFNSATTIPTVRIPLSTKMHCVHQYGHYVESTPFTEVAILCGAAAGGWVDLLRYLRFTPDEVSLPAIEFAYDLREHALRSGNLTLIKFLHNRGVNMFNGGTLRTRPWVLFSLPEVNLTQTLRREKVSGLMPNWSPRKSTDCHVFYFDQTALHIATSRARHSHVELLLEQMRVRGVDVRALLGSTFPVYYKKADADGVETEVEVQMSYLHLVADNDWLYGCPKTIDILLEYYHPLNIRGGLHNDTPLHHAARCCNTVAMTHFLQVGADATAKDSEGKTPIEVFQELASPEVKRMATGLYETHRRRFPHLPIDKK